MISLIAVTVLTVLYLAVTLWLCRGLKLNAKALTLGGLACGLTLVLESIYIPLPTGSVITCGSWVPLMLVALVYDYRLAMVGGWVCGVLSIILLPAWQPVHWAQIFVEHLVCFSCLGYAGLLGSERRSRVAAASFLAIFIKFWGHVFSGVIFFSQNAWDGWGAWGYSLAYHLSSKVPAGILTIAILLALPLKTLRKATRGGEA